MLVVGSGLCDSSSVELGPKDDDEVEVDVDVEVEMEEDVEADVEVDSEGDGTMVDGTPDASLCVGLGAMLEPWPDPDEDIVLGFELDVKPGVEVAVTVPLDCGIVSDEAMEPVFETSPLDMPLCGTLRSIVAVEQSVENGDHDIDAATAAVGRGFTYGTV